MAGKMRDLTMDYMKGVAILLVVIGHVIEKGMGIGAHLINLISASFFMALFFFVSGFVGARDDGYKSILGSVLFLVKKIQRILLPYVVVGGLVFLIQNGGQLGKGGHIYGGFWFLPALFFMTVFLSMGRCAVWIVLKMDNVWLDVARFVVTWVLVAGLYFRFGNVFPAQLQVCKFFPFFAFGDFVGRYSALRRFVQGDRIVEFALIVYVLCFVFWRGSLIGWALCGLSAIIVIWSLLERRSSSLPKILGMIGRESMAIYCLHWFFLPNLSWMACSLTHGGAVVDNGNVVIVAFVSFVISGLVISFCLGTAGVLRRSVLMRQLLLGEGDILTKRFLAFLRQDAR